MDKSKNKFSNGFAIEESAKRKEQTLDKMIPKELMTYRSVFDKIAANRFPDRRPWDHAIDLQPDFIPKKAHIYPLSLPEQEKLKEFIMENLELHSTVEITTSITILLCQDERWEITTSTRLSTTQ